MGMGGAIHSEGAKEFRLVQSTVSRNSAELTGGGIHNAGSMTIARSIVAENDAGPDGGDVFGTELSTTESAGHNLFGRLAGSAISAPTDIEAEEAGLADLEDNGGPTPTMALDAASPAIDAIGPHACLGLGDEPLTVDQRGAPRPVGDGCDIGAYEGP